MKRIVLALLGILVIGALVGAFGGQASATPVAAEPVAAAGIAVTVDESGTPIAMCMMPGDSIGLRAGIGAVIGFFAGLPIFVVGAIPGALIGAGFGALSWQIANWSANQMPGPC
ncbi:hypothetical protein LTV02_33560 [Nocardia yamanashiensis]|uniref:hypothetical protein n=1 Tax=Nocardia yamanashiensis TaxID=209247 RepID=UPI001E4288D6|nr:hypothetical protein [Nocardia yamanashiensis]UGT40856.1 hypothetical protein LTV02_33560 [Nocardia yamanashiensis]